MAKSVVDRKSERDDFLRILNNTSESKAIVLSSPTGVGKSTLSSEFSYLVSKDYAVVSLQTTPVNKAEARREGEYLKNMFSSVYRKFQDTPRMSFDYFIRHSKNRSLRKDIMSSFLEASYNNFSKAGVLKAIWFFMTQKLLGLGSYNEFLYISEDSKKNFYVLKEYVKFVLNQGNVVLILDNVQNIDSTSLKCIKECISETSRANNCFVFEFTLTDTDSHKDSLLFREQILQTGIPTEYYPLDNLRVEDAYRAVVLNLIGNEESKGAFFSEKYTTAKKHYLLKAKGNIRELEDFAILLWRTRCVSNQDEYDIDNAVIANLEVLSRELQYVLSILALHDGRMRIADLKAIVDEKLVSSYEATISELKGYVKIKMDHIEIEHASIVDAVGFFLESKKVPCLLAYRHCTNYYSNILTEQRTFFPDYCIIRLLSLYSWYEPDRIFDLFENLVRIIHTLLSPENAWLYIEKFLTATQGRGGMQSILYRIIDLCLELDLTSQALTTFSLLGAPQKYDFTYSFYKCSVNLALAKFEQVIHSAEDALNVETLDSSRLYFELFIIVSYRSTNQYSKLSSIVRRIKTHSGYSYCLAQGYFLKFAELYMRKDDAIAYVEASIAFFEANNLHIQKCKSYISLSYLYAINGDLEAACRVCDFAEKGIKKNFINEFIFDVNRASIELLSDNFSESVWVLLSKAELLTNSPFNLLAIINNKIIWCLENSKFDSSIFLTNQAETYLSTVEDKHLKAIVYYNLSLLHEGSPVGMHYLAKATVLQEHCNVLTIRLRGETPQSKHERFLLSKRWHICFLSFWDIEILEQVAHTHSGQLKNLTI